LHVVRQRWPILGRAPIPAVTAEARRSIAAYFEFYNHERLHQALGYRARRQVFEESLRVAQLRRGRKTANANRKLAAQ